MKFDGYSLNITIKGIMLWERLFNSNFYEIQDDGQQLSQLVYCLFCASNPQVVLKYKTFVGMVEGNQKIAKWVGEKMKEIMYFMGQFPTDEEDSEEISNEAKEEAEKLSITDMATSLIVDYGVSADYVMNEMQVWEISSFYKAAESRVRRRYEENRLWTYMQLLPHMSSKHSETPDKFMPFPWEKAEKKIDDKTAKAAYNFLKNNGRRNDNSPQQGGSSGSGEMAVGDERSGQGGSDSECPESRNAGNPTGGEIEPGPEEQSQKREP